MDLFVLESKRRCCNCANLSYTGINEVFHCDNDAADRHPMYRTMEVGEAMTMGCKNCWEYSRPLDQLLKMAPIAEKFIIKAN